MCNKRGVVRVGILRRLSSVLHMRVASREAIMVSSGNTRRLHISKRLGAYQLSTYSRGEEADFPECVRSGMGIWAGKEWMVAIFEDCLLKFVTRLN